MVCIRSTAWAVVSILALIGFFVVVSMSMACHPSFDQVRDNLNAEREVYELEPVFAHDCAELVTAFDGYVELVTYTVERTDPYWETIATSECTTLEAHVSAVNRVCPGVYEGLPADTIQRCADAGVDMGD